MARVETTALIAGAAFFLLIGSWVGKSIGREEAKTEFRHEAVESGYAEWEIHSERGRPYDDQVFFRWRFIDRKTGVVHGYKIEQ